MPFDSSVIKRALLAAVAVISLTLAVNLGYGLVFLQWRNASLPEIVRQARVAAPYAVLGLFLATAGGILGRLLAAGRPPRACSLIGLAAGAGLGLLVIGGEVIQGNFELWIAPNAIMAVVGGWLGGRLVRRI